MHLHCDNCSGQNKNKMMMWYLCWRVLHGLHTDITINFLITGHTKFAPDWGFGLIKQTYRRTVCNTLHDIARVIGDSTVTRMNMARIVGSESQRVTVRMFDWASYLSPFFKPLQGIKALQHIRYVLN